MSRSMIAAVVAAGGLFALSGCAGTGYGEQPPAGVTGSPSAATPVGTVWQLVEFQSMDDAQGITRPDEPERYTMELMADGRAAFRFDCNRGMGGYELSPSEDGETGSLTFAAVASTRALCPPPSLGGRLASDMAHIRGYVLREGRLYTTLMADGGIYVWKPGPAE